MSPGHVTLDKSCSKCLPWLRRQTRNRNLIFNRPSALSHYRDRPGINSEVLRSVKSQAEQRQTGILQGQDLFFPDQDWGIASQIQIRPSAWGANSNLGLICIVVCLFVWFVGWHNVSLSSVGRPHWRHSGSRSDTPCLTSCLQCPYRADCPQPCSSKMLPGWLFPLNSHPWTF